MTALPAVDSLDARRADHAARVGIVRELLDRRGSPGALLTSRRNFAWLTAGGANHVVLETETGAAAILVSRDTVTVLAPNIEADRLRDEEVAGLGIEVVPLPWWQPEAIDAEARRRAGGQPAGDGDLERQLVGDRSRLSELDHERLAWLGDVAAAAADGVLAGVAGGMTEDHLGDSLLGRLDGTRVPVLLIAADDRIVRYRHPLPGSTPIRHRVMLVLVAERWGLHVALTRFRELERSDAELARRWDAVRHVQAALHDATRPGATLGDVFEAGRRAYAEVGFPDEWQLHHQGGTIGYQGRERIAVPDDPTPIEADMAFAWNPSITGTKAEETFVLARGDQRIVTTTR